jgi:hypothetical protein
MGTSVLDRYNATVPIYEALPCTADTWTCMSARVNHNYELWWMPNLAPGALLALSLSLLPFALHV